MEDVKPKKKKFKKKKRKENNENQRLWCPFVFSFVLYSLCHFETYFFLSIWYCINFSFRAQLALPNKIVTMEYNAFLFFFS